mmetsp:Transcript_35129/g.79179  ORF Transcript_35129/g.79179 Transcript_35129/m.79179 type:complete len:315 (+) Transcript_35129:1535-2479(+)
MVLRHREDDSPLEGGGGAVVHRRLSVAASRGALLSAAIIPQLVAEVVRDGVLAESHPGTQNLAPRCRAAELDLPLRPDEVEGVALLAFVEERLAPFKTRGVQRVGNLLEILNVELADVVDALQCLAKSDVPPHRPHGKDAAEGRLLDPPERARRAVGTSLLGLVRVATRDAVGGGRAVVQKTKLAEALAGFVGHADALPGSHLSPRAGRAVRVEVPHRTLPQYVEVTPRLLMAQYDFAWIAHGVLLEGVDDLLHLTFSDLLVVAQCVGEDEIPLECEGDKVGVVGRLGIDRRVVSDVELDCGAVDVAQYICGDT